MDRRVLFLAEPAPLLCEGESLLSTSAASSVARYPHNSATNGHDNSRVGHDLRHLRRVLDDLSRFCRDQQQLTCITARKASAGSSTRLPVSRGALCKAEVLTAAQGRRQRVGAGGVDDISRNIGGGGSTSTSSTNSNINNYNDTNGNSRNSGSGSSSRRVLLAAVFPCPPPPAGLNLDGEVGITGTALGVVNATETRDGGGQQQHADHEGPQRKLDLLASAFAEVLDGCGVWLTPQDFQARVLVPTRALIDLQLCDRSSFACNDGDDVDGSAAAAATTDVQAHPAQTTGNGGDIGDAVGDDVRSPRRSKRRRCTSTPPSAAKSPKVSPAPMSPSATSSAHLGRHVGMEADGDGDGDGGGAQASTLPLLGVPLPEERRGTPALTVPGDANNIGHGPSSPFKSGVVAPTLPQASLSPASSSPPSAVQLGGLLSAANPEIISVTAINGGADCRAVDHGHGATGMAVLEEDFSRGAAEEIAELLRAAAAAAAGGDAEMAGCPRSMAVGGVGGVQSDRDIIPRGRVLFDVVWAAASLPEGGPYCSGAQKSPVRSKETPTPMCLTERSAGETHDAAGVSLGEILPNTLSRLTLSAPAGESRSAPLREALSAVCETFIESRVTIWPSNGSVASAGFPASALTPAKNMGGAPLGGVAAEDTDTVDFGRSERQSEGGVSARTRELRRQWGPWRSSISGARLFFGGGPRDRLGHDGGSTGEDEEQNTAVVLEPGLLWRGPVVAAATVTPPAEAPSFTASRSPAPDQASIFPALKGFALRVAACWPRGDSTSDGRKAEEDDILRTVPGSTAAVSRAAAGVLARAPALRLSRVISPATVARVCHLLADGAVAPALELYAYDAERFPGGAAFLEGWAADGRGMLLVAAATVAEDRGCEERGATGASAARGEEGLAMACFPTNGIFRAGRERGGSGGESGAAVWSVTLFRRPSEFSEEAVAALVSGRGGCLRGSPRGPMARMTLQDSHRTGALVNGMSQGGLGYEVNEAVAAVGVGPGGAPEGLELVLEGDRGAPPAAQSLRRSSRRARCRTNDASLENDAMTKSSQENNRGSEQTPTVGGTKGVPPVGANIADIVGGLPVFTWQSLLAEASAVVAGPAPSSASSSREKAPLASKDGVGNNILDTAVSLGKEPGTTAVPTAAEVGVGPAMDAHSAGRGACGSTTLAPTRGTRANKHLVGAEVSGEGVNNALGGVGCTASAASFSAAARLADPTVATAYALYGSFGTWGGGSPDGARRFSWAEEALLPTGGNRQMFSIETSDSRAGDAAASAAPPLAASGGSGIDPRTAAALGKDKVVLAERGSTDRTAGSSSSGVGDAAAAMAAAVAAPPRRALSTAEEALEKAGHQQRARVKERRLVAREQRARMDRPRPRSRQGGGVGSSRASAAGGGGGGTGASGSGVIRRPSGGAVGGAGRGGGGGGGAFRRGVAAAVPSSVSVTGRSVSGSKLSRGSLILGRSVGGVGAATDSRAVVAGGANAPGAGSGASVARAERDASGAGSGTPSAFGGSSLVQPPVNAGALSRGFGAAAAAAGGDGTNNSNKEKQPPGTAVPSSSRSSLSAADASRVRRAIFQDQPPPPPPPPPIAPPVAPMATTNPEGVTAKRPSPLPLASLRSTTSVEGDRRREEAGGDATTAAAGFSPAEAPRVGAVRAAAAVTAEVERAPAAADGTGASESLKVSWEETGQQQVRSARMGGLLAGGGPGVGAGGSLGGGDPMMRQVIERAMRSAVASQMGLPEGDSRVGDVFEREIRLMGGGGVGGGS